MNAIKSRVHVSDGSARKGVERTRTVGSKVSPFGTTLRLDRDPPEDGVHSHVRQALENGATREEIRHAIILLTSTIGFPTVSTALSWAEDIFGAGGAQRRNTQAR